MWVRQAPLSTRVASVLFASVVGLSSVATVDVSMPGTANAAVAVKAWSVRVASGANGIATLRSSTTGTGTLALALLRLPSSASITVTLRKGTCGAAGSLLASLPSFRSSNTGGGVRTTRLSSTTFARVRAALALPGKVALRVRTGATSRCGVFVALVEQKGFLARQGSELLLAGAPFHELSFNKYDLLQQFAVSPEGAWGDNGPNSVGAGERALRNLDAKGFRVVRTSVSPYANGWFEQAFFDADPGKQAQKRREFFAGFDAMLEACDRHGIRVVASLMWNVLNIGDLGRHSLHEGIVNPSSLGRERTEEFIRAVVTRYRDRPTIAMWEIGNEFNLVADLQFPNGVWGPEPWTTGLVRDGSNNFTSDELAVFYRDIATLIRSIDSRHLITTGSSAPRPAAMHLLRAARVGAPIDWTFDSAAELTEYMRLTHPDPIDALSIHYNEDPMVSLGGTMGSPENLRFYAAVAKELAKPLLVGEIGYSPDVRRYDTPAALSMMRATLPVIVELGLPLTLYWTFNDDRGMEETEKGLDLRYGKTDEALLLIEAAAAQLRP
jgi:hypothetical protein